MRKFSLRSFKNLCRDGSSSSGYSNLYDNRGNQKVLIICCVLQCVPLLPLQYDRFWTLCFLHFSEDSVLAAAMACCIFLSYEIEAISEQKSQSFYIASHEEVQKNEIFWLWRSQYRVSISIQRCGSSVSEYHFTETQYGGAPSCWKVRDQGKSNIFGII